ncbi:MAG: chemotaxis protein CheA [Peptostreptococcaceae bacterium]|nr:chemotaxis protein CheA [Peptostreptococcaceae bacterium]
MLDFEQYIDIFLDESKDHLQNLNQSLLDFESSPENLETVNEIFRIAHTLKGMSATMGFETIAKLTHKMENILDGIRSQRLEVIPMMIDALFEGLDILEEEVKSIESTGKEKFIDISEIIERLDRMEKGEPVQGVVKEEASLKEEATALSMDPNLLQLNIHKSELESILTIAKKLKEEEYSIYKVFIQLEESCMLKSARAFLVFRALEEHGEIVFSDPSADDIEDEKFERSFTVLYSSKSPVDSIRKDILDVSEVEKAEIEEYALESIHAAPEKQEDAEGAKEEKEEKQESGSEPEEPKRSPGTKAESARPQDQSKKAKAGKTVRVDIDRLDNLMNLVSELIIVKTRLEDHEVSSDTQNMGEAIEYLERITTNLHDAVTKVRMVPVERVFNRFPRMVRDLSKDLRKEIDLFMSGEETEVDRTVIDEIGDPLIHLLRNSIDHGVETPEVRKSKGKPEKGKVNLIAYPDGNTVVIEVSDDGAGINVAKVRDKAISRGVLTEEQAYEMEPNKIAEMIFAPGFSTADKISDVSGRGVGLDVVKTKIEALGGTVEIATEPDKGSSFIIRLPLTLAIIQALLVIVSGEKYAIPLNNIKEITDIKVSDIRLIEKKEVILYRGQSLPLLRLARVLECAEEMVHEEEVTVVIVKKGDKEIGIIVDRLIGQQEIVIKSLGKYLSGVKEIAGATILGNGGVALIIDTNSLF